MLRRLLLFLLLLPVVELIVLVNVHRFLKFELGSGPPLLIILTSLIVSGILGIRLARLQGIRLLLQARERLQQGTLPNQDLIEGLLLVVGGIALLIPGYISDLLGLLLLVPRLRRWAAKRVKSWLGNGLQAGHYQVYRSASPSGRAQAGRAPSLSQQADVIDVEAIDSKGPFKSPG